MKSQGDRVLTVVKIAALIQASWRFPPTLVDVSGHLSAIRSIRVVHPTTKVGYPSSSLSWGHGRLRCGQDGFE